jgi:hypothetical protein
MHMGVFSPIISHDLLVSHIVKGPSGGQSLTEQTTIGIRVCPNAECRGILFVVVGKDGVISFPNEVLSFDPKDIPLAIADSLAEAIKCHAAGCYRASALMVRRTLEELCENRSATGSDLKARIAALSTKIVIASDLLTAADNLRLLGNDAAHIEAKYYQSIGEEEVVVAIELTQELLKAVYQYKGLVDRLTALKRP